MTRSSAVISIFNPSGISDRSFKGPTLNSEQVQHQNQEKVQKEVVDHYFGFVAIADGVHKDEMVCIVFRPKLPHHPLIWTPY